MFFPSFILLFIFNWRLNHKHCVLSDPHSAIHTPPHGTSSPPPPPLSAPSPTPPSAFPAHAGTSPVTVATDT